MEAIGDPEKVHDIPMHSTIDRLELNHEAWMEIPYTSGLSDEGSSSIDEEESTKSESPFGLGFWADSPPFDPESGLEAPEHGQDPGPLGCPCAPNS